MIYTVENTEHRNVKVFDRRGTPMHGVTYLDTYTGEIEMYLMSEGKLVMNSLSDDASQYLAEPVKIKTVIRGTYVEINGERK